MSLQNGPTHVVTCIQKPTKWTYTYMYTETYEMALLSIYTYFIHTHVCPYITELSVYEVCVYRDLQNGPTHVRLYKPYFAHLKMDLHSMYTSLQNVSTKWTYICRSLQNGPTHVCLYEMDLHSIYTYFIHTHV